MQDTTKPVQLCEIARSFSYKLNVGNYESRDFFCSQKAECPITDAERVSGLLHHFCKEQVMRAVALYRAETSQALAQPQQPRQTTAKPGGQF